MGARPGARDRRDASRLVDHIKQSRKAKKENESNKWNRILASEGMPAELPQVKPRPRVDRNWVDHFGGRNPKFKAGNDACDRIRLDMTTTQDLWSMLEDIRWGRHDPTIPVLTAAELRVFGPYCDGLAETAIAELLGISQSSVSVRLRRIIGRFTVTKPRLARGVRPKKS